MINSICIYKSKILQYSKKNGDATLKEESLPQCGCITLQHNTKEGSAASGVFYSLQDTSHSYTFIL